MKIFTPVFSAKATAFAVLVTLASLAQANATSDPHLANARPGTPALKPQLGTLVGLKIAGATGGTSINGPFKSTDTLSATVTGATGGQCGIAITSTATMAQPVAFAVEASHPFPLTRVFQNLQLGSHSVTATPTAGPNFPACLGAAITVDFVVVQ